MFVICLTRLLSYLSAKGFSTLVMSSQSCNLYVVRNACLGGIYQKGMGQKVFKGDVDYDYLLWIDSDIIANPEDLDKLFALDKDIASGMYRVVSTDHFACGWTNPDGSYKYITDDTIPESPIMVDFTGFGFLLVRKGVFESIGYPWFRSDWQDEIEFDDVNWCKRVREKGFDVWLCPKVKVGHEKIHTFY